MSPIQLARQKARESGVPLYSPQGVKMALRLHDSLRRREAAPRPGNRPSRPILAPLGLS